MRRFPMLMALLALTLLALDYAASAIGPASIRPTAKTVYVQGAYTPAEGSQERKAILDALRARMKKLSGLNVIFVVRHLKVKSGWAWAETEPQSPDGANRYEPVAGLLRKKGKRWTVAQLLDEGDDRGEAMRKLRAKHRSAPADIFP